MGQSFEERANQSHRLGSTERAKLGKPQIAGCRDEGGRGCGFLLGTSAASLGRDTENIVLSFCFSFSFFRHAELIFLFCCLRQYLFYCSAAVWGLDRFRKLNFPWTKPLL